MSKLEKSLGAIKIFVFLMFALTMGAGMLTVPGGEYMLLGIVAFLLLIRHVLSRFKTPTRSLKLQWFTYGFAFFFFIFWTQSWLVFIKLASIKLTPLYSLVFMGWVILVLLVGLAYEMRRQGTPDWGLKLRWFTYGFLSVVSLLYFPLWLPKILKLFNGGI